MFTFAPSNTVNPLKTKKIKAASSIRFRRWSRAGYAIFCSLARTVSIGSVTASISDKSLQKAVGVSKNSFCALVSKAESSEKSMEVLELEATLQKIQETSILQITSESAAACPQNPYIYLLISTVEMSLSHLNRFLFYSI